MIKLSPTSWTAIALVAVLQTAALAWMVYGRVSLLRDGREIVAEVIPVDPRDLFRGDYVVLGYTFGNREVPVPEGTVQGDKVYVTLKPAGPDREVVGSFATLSPPGDPTHVVLKGIVSYVSSLPPRASCPRRPIRYGIESYFVPEGTGLALEQQVRDKKIAAVLRGRHRRRRRHQGIVAWTANASMRNRFFNNKAWLGSRDCCEPRLSHPWAALRARCRAAWMLWRRPPSSAKRSGRIHSTGAMPRHDDHHAPRSERGLFQGRRGEWICLHGRHRAFRPLALRQGTDGGSPGRDRSAAGSRPAPRSRRSSRPRSGLNDIRHREAMNEAYKAWTGGKDTPVRACVEAKLVDPRMLVEISVVAAK